MMTHRVAAFALLLCVKSICVAGHPNQSKWDLKTQSSISASNATAFAVTYGYPLTQYAATFDSLLATNGSNTLYHHRITASPSSAAIVRPNVDTLYSMAAIDLSHSDVVLTIPPVNDNRFYVFPFYDLWSNNFANLGTVNSTLPGKYLLRFVGASKAVGFESPSPNCSEYLGFINFPTVYGLTLPRILLRSNTSTELDAVHRIQDQIEIQEIPRHIEPIAPKLTPQLLGNGSISSLATRPSQSLDKSGITQLLKVLARFVNNNPPANRQEAQVVKRTFRKAGLDNGHYTPPPGLNITLVQQYMDAEMESLVNCVQTFSNGWLDFLPQYSGYFSNQYAVRSYIANIGYLQLVQYEALYPEYAAGFLLSENQSYILNFPSGKPPVIDAGFWSLTVYNSSSYLVQNPLNRYSLGDRSNLTYPDGDLVYGNGSSDRNDVFSILLQSANVPPPANWTSNWLPTPAGGGNFTVNLRFYGPTQELKASGSYVYPTVTKQSSLVVNIYD
ncbi:hypothetical protein BGW36DRAFT_360166 [Talaromyces proteolyticus]|uniref:DUF1254 domain-containing protein n=1 Tax=Talaromyces proteolyticus TaxID=1131652 RepID=A0AAD4PVA4_9EURO|nr:uncharacterized protein BGW36DRAFT_360166 [Talaromyces proteolyticus]KAH8696320.1 hypothetical protein BGW36DRAFT_360166 [Talaromyces proteolyticus]